ncbi:MAG: hypothetical protein V4612_02710 [Pseudomonadota bacterium]
MLKHHLSKLVALASDLPPESEDLVRKILEKFNETQFLSLKKSYKRKQFESAINDLLELLLQHSLISENDTNVIRQDIFAHPENNKQYLEELKNAFEHILEAHNNRRKVNEFRVKNAKLVSTPDGKNLNFIYHIELIDDLGRSATELMNNKTIQYFSLINCVVQDLQKNNHAVTQDNIIAKIMSVYAEKEHPIKTSIHNLGHSRLPKSFSFLEEDYQEKLVQSYLKILNQNNRKALGAKEHWHYALKFEREMDPNPIKRNNFIYLNSKEREAYRVQFHDGKLYQDEKELDTTILNSKFKDRGVAAFVLSRDGNLYVNEHMANQFNHSSFLSGDITASSGMIEIEKGKVMKIDNVSGHYKPNEVEMVRIVKAIPQECFVAADFSDINKRFTYVVTDFTPEETRKKLATLKGSANESEFLKTYWAIGFEEGRKRMYPIIVQKLPEDHQEVDGIIEGNMKIIDILTVYDLIQETESYELEAKQKKEAWVNSLKNTSSQQTSTNFTRLVDTKSDPNLFGRT